MRILFDQGTPVAIRNSFPGHTVVTSYEQGWSTLSNGALLNAAESAGFDVFLTTDSSIPYQQNLSGRKFAIVILSQNRWTLIQAALPRVIEAVLNAKRGSCTIVEV